MDLSKISVTISFNLSTTFSASSTHSSADVLSHWAEHNVRVSARAQPSHYRCSLLLLQGSLPCHLLPYRPAPLPSYMRQEGMCLAATHLLPAKMDSAPFLFQRKLEIVNTQEQYTEYSLGSTLLPSFLLFKTFSSGQSLKELSNFLRGN